MASGSIWCYMKKGWTAYVRGHEKYTDHYEDVEWGEGTQKKTEEKVGNKTIIKFK